MKANELTNESDLGSTEDGSGARPVGNPGRTASESPDRESSAPEGQDPRGYRRSAGKRQNFGRLFTRQLPMKIKGIKW